MKKVIVLGGGGQLAQCIQNVEKVDLDIVYLNSTQANILEEGHLREVFKSYQPEVVVNCAAYTAVDMAEDELLKAAAINSQAPKLIAQLCMEYDAILIHISTDFVFDGTKTTPLTEEDFPNPISTYGKTKLLGEEAIIATLDKHVIIRTSWLYSEFGNNFLKTMMRLGLERKEMGIVFDQLGTPTYAMDLANVIIEIAQLENPAYGLYHYSNEGAASWYDFAHSIFKYANINIQLKPIRTFQYPTKATRPAYSVMDKTKIKETFGITIPHWLDSLERCIKNI
ncbi:dTDP-4-dehydrorhamnose reductase [Albibacterium bauzanense]|uniref:dTDP-4-dehydrorhamnose reductase n=1 Tax=Albibacterium bauzanense TaxID=653929 RepID=A0A4R1M146_9SPHI|nr:dTDP-4-dehydrorhamnose reductase [Albibacterium bauzanense]TCK83259.1 dTDP-4-dehydrorhamnose reductase [Albibacterium bauzanense]